MEKLVFTYKKMKKLYWILQNINIKNNWTIRYLKN